MKTNRNLFAIVCVILLSLALVPLHAAIDWKDAGTDWGTGTNWVGDNEPGATDVANFPAAATIANQPNVGATGTRNPLGITIDNSQADYSITGSGILTLGGGGLTISGGGTSGISAEMRIDADQAWDIGDSIVNHTGKFRLRNDSGVTNLTISGPGTITFPAGEGSGGTGSRGDLNRTEGIMNINWGYAAHNSSRPSLIATGTGTVNLNTVNAASFLDVRAGGSGEVVAKADQNSIQNLSTGYTAVGGTITVEDGVTISTAQPVMTGGTIRTQGTGVAVFHDLTFRQSSETAYIEGIIRSGRAGNPTISGGNGLWLHASNQGVGDYRLDVSATIADHASGSGLGLNHGYSGYFHGSGVIRLSGLNTYTGLTFIGGGTFLLGNDAPVNAPGVFGVAASTITVGFNDRHGQISILTDGPFTIARDFDIQQGTDSNWVTFGGNTADISEFSGTIGLTSMAPANLRLTAADDGIVDFSGQVMPGANKGIQKVGGGTVILSTDNTYTGNTTVSAGTLLAGHDNAFATGAVTVADGTAIGVINGATITNDTTFAGTYTLIGDGTFKPANIATLTVGSESAVAPGSSVGTLTVGDITFESGSALNIEIFGDTSYDQLISDGTLTIDGGVLNVTFEDGYQPSMFGATYDILGWTGFGGGEFDTINLPVLSGLLHWNLDMLYLDGTIQAIPEPTSLALLGLGALAMLKRRRR